MNIRRVTMTELHDLLNESIKTMMQLDTVIEDIKKVRAYSYVRFHSVRSDLHAALANNDYPAAHGLYHTETEWLSCITEADNLITETEKEKDTVQKVAVQCAIEIDRRNGE